jgi:hypothetical protein
MELLKKFTRIQLIASAIIVAAAITNIILFGVPTY